MDEIDYSLMNTHIFGDASGNVCYCIQYKCKLIFQADNGKMTVLR